MRARIILASLVAISLAGSAQANFLRGKCKARNECCDPCANACGNPCAPACGQPCTMTVNCYEWVQEQRQVCCTTYRQEQKQITCTGYRCETYSEPCVKTVCCKRYVTEQVMECRTVCERVPVWTEKTVMKTRYVTQQHCETRTRCVDKGHWECKEVPCDPCANSGGKSGGGLLGRLCKKKKGNDCCDPCANPCADACCAPCPKTKTVRCWVPNMVTESYQVTCCKRVPVCEPCTVKVCCYQTCTKQIQVPVCKTRCITEQKQVTYNVCKTRSVPYTYTKTVCCCVPVQEMKTVTVCVRKCVQKQVNVGCCGAAVSCCR